MGLTGKKVDPQLALRPVSKIIDYMSSHLFSEVYVISWTVSHNFTISLYIRIPFKQEYQPMYRSVINKIRHTQYNSACKCSKLPLHYFLISTNSVQFAWQSFEQSIRFRLSVVWLVNIRLYFFATINMIARFEQ